MKRILTICFAAFISVSVSMGSETYIEKFISSERAHLSNLTIVSSMTTVIPSVGEDIPGFGLANSNARSGEIRYKVQGASQVTIGFYSRNSAYACRYGNGWINGMPTSHYTGDSLPVYMDSSGALYIHDGTNWCQLQKGTGLTDPEMFNPVSKAPVSTIPLNLNVSVIDSSGHAKTLSGNSSGFRPLVNSFKSIVGYYEERTYMIPGDTKELVIGLNYPWEGRDLSGNPIPALVTNYPVVVDRIQIDGDDLLFDQKDQGGSSSSGSSESGGDGNHSDDEIILPDNSSENTQTDRTEMPVSSEESSSLISSTSESSSRSRKSSSGGKKSSSGRDDHRGKSDRASSEPESETLIYQTDRDSVRDKLFSLMLVGYGIIGLGIAWQIYQRTIHKR